MDNVCSCVQQSIRPTGAKIMLREIKQLLEKHGRLSLRELASHFAMSPDTLEPMLELLIQKKQIRLIDFSCSSGKSCSGCTCISRDDAMQYELATPQ